MAVTRLMPLCKWWGQVADMRQIKDQKAAAQPPGWGRVAAMQRGGGGANGRRAAAPTLQVTRAGESGQDLVGGESKWPQRDLSCFASGKGEDELLQRGKGRRELLQQGNLLPPPPQDALAGAATKRSLLLLLPRK